MALGSRDSNRANPAHWLSALLFLSGAACGDGAELRGYGEAAGLFGGATQQSASRARNTRSDPDSNVTESAESFSETADAEPESDSPVAGDNAPEPAEEAAENSEETAPSVAEHDAGVAVSDSSATPAATQADAGAAQEDAGAAQEREDAGATQADAGAPLIDIQIVAVTAVLRASELARSAQVSGLLRTDAVKTFASETQTAHEAAVAREAALLLKKRFTPKPNYASLALAADVEAALATLRTACGADADTAYLEAQIAMSERELAVVEGVLIRDVCDGDLKLELLALRDQLKAQLTRARALKSGL